MICINTTLLTGGMGGVGNIWNSLPNHVVLAVYTNSFKSRLVINWRNQDIFATFSVKSWELEAEARLVQSINF